MAETAAEQRARLARKRRSLYDEALIKCPECPLSFAKLGSHVVQVHGYETAKEFRKAYGLDYKTGKDTTIASYRAKKSRLAKENGTIHNLKHGKDYRFNITNNASHIVKAYWQYKRDSKHLLPQKEPRP